MNRSAPSMHLLQRWFVAGRPFEAWGGMKTQAKEMAAPAAPGAGIKRINLAGIATKSPAAKTAKAYPVLPDTDGQAAALVEGILDKSEQLEALEGGVRDRKGRVDRPGQAVLLRPTRGSDGRDLVGGSKGTGESGTGGVFQLGPRQRR